MKRLSPDFPLSSPKSKKQKINNNNNNDIIIFKKGLPDLSGLNDIKWETLENAYGFSDNVPHQIRQLLNPNSSCGSFYSNLLHQGTIYAATVQVIPFLIEMLIYEDITCKEDIIELLTNIIVPFNENITAKTLKYTAIGNEYENDCFNEINKGIHIFIQMLDYYSLNTKIIGKLCILLSVLPDSVKIISDKMFSYIIDNSLDYNIRIASLIYLNMNKGGLKRDKYLEFIEKEINSESINEYNNDYIPLWYVCISICILCEIIANDTKFNNIDTIKGSKPLFNYLYYGIESGNIFYGIYQIELMIIDIIHHLLLLHPFLIDEIIQHMIDCKINEDIAYLLVSFLLKYQFKDFINSHKNKENKREFPINLLNQRQKNILLGVITIRHYFSEMFISNKIKNTLKLNFKPTNEELDNIIKTFTNTQKSARSII